MKEKLKERIEALKQGLNEVDKQLSDYTKAIQKLMETKTATKGAIFEAERILQELDAKKEQENVTPSDN